MDGMSSATAELWALQNRQEGDRHRLFAALRSHVGDGAVIARDGDDRVRTEDLDGYLVPERPELAERAKILECGRGVGYTKSAFAYVFERIR